MQIEFVGRVHRLSSWYISGGSEQWKRVWTVKDISKDLKRSDRFYSFSHLSYREIGSEKNIQKKG